ncbi:hypothetical protein C5E45_15750 [Nocardia nova]|uniref:Uncharacterized protein n=1 Tax=Nocardia nova TaxID=37330 RepID=A0A2S6APG1_9NOCA|nr:hypothetical protein C5E41_15095 [Nocardia nova]PPJ37125.1 hypothetical protein C5E45_15750 [Nocardia nova]
MNRRWCATVGATPSGALLVRPNQVIAWREPTAPDDATAAFEHVWARIFACRGGERDPAGRLQNSRSARQV